jgi:hypothetical protein
MMYDLAKAPQKFEIKNRPFCPFFFRENRL